MWWKDDERLSLLVVIGRNLDHTEITEGFEGCRVLQTA